MAPGLWLASALACAGLRGAQAGGARDPALFAAWGVFPDYDNPITAEPPLPHPKASHGRPCAAVQPVVDAQLKGYGQVVSAPYAPPEACGPGRWDQVVLQLTGAVRGVQFDRFGALWLRGVELLRLTTPEPSPEGIVWQVVKDVTEYAELFAQPGNVTLQIPNVVDSTYTGVLHVNVSFSFYSAKSEDDGTERLRPHIVPIRNVTGASNPLNTVATNGAVSHSFSQVNSVTLPGNIREAYLDLFASGHACEEFWYTNAINATAGGCGGGAYRELDVFVDGHLAGAQLPFPVLYTGGVNPLLWRPLTGILSFDIPAYRFDLTPFLGWLNDGKAHNLTFSVLGNWNGTWYLDGVLVLYEDPAGVQGGTVEVLPSPPRQLRETLRNESGIMVQEMVASVKYHVRGTLHLEGGMRAVSEVQGELVASSGNYLLSSSTQNTVGSFSSATASLRDGQLLRRTVVAFPLEVNDSSAQDSKSFQLNSCVKFGRYVNTSFGMDYTIGMSNGMHSCAVYNRSTTGPRVVNVELNDVQEDFQVTAGPQTAAPCYQKRLAARNGAVTADEGHDACEWTEGVYACGSDVCGNFGGAFVAPLRMVSGGGAAATAATGILPVRSKHLGSSQGPCLLPVRGFVASPKALVCSEGAAPTAALRGRDAALLE